MSGEAAVIAVYDPPEAGLPYLAVVIYSDGEVSGIAVETAAAAQHLVEELAVKVGIGIMPPDRAIPSDPQRRAAARWKKI